MLHSSVFNKTLVSMKKVQVQFKSLLLKLWLRGIKLAEASGHE